MLNLRAILDRLKRTYNVDENRIVLSGVSDGGTASFYVAMRDPTPFASFPALERIADGVGPGATYSHFGDLFPNNLLNKPFFVVNGERDVLYPSAAIEPMSTRVFSGPASRSPIGRSGVPSTTWRGGRGSYRNSRRL